MNIWDLDLKDVKRNTEIGMGSEETYLSQCQTGCRNCSVGTLCTTCRGDCNTKNMNTCATKCGTCPDTFYDC